jgi:hypothetical protein
MRSLVESHIEPVQFGVPGHAQANVPNFKLNRRTPVMTSSWIYQMMISDGRTELFSPKSYITLNTDADVRTVVKI